jgi:hypothetical protein
MRWEVEEQAKTVASCSHEPQAMLVGRRGVRRIDLGLPIR